MLQAPWRVAGLIRSKRFPLLWYFVATSFIAIAAVSVALAFLLDTRDERRFIERAEEQSIDEADHILELFYWNIVQNLDQAVLDNPSTLLMDAIKPKLPAFTRMTTFGLNIAKFSVFDLQGNLVHATSPVTGSEQQAAHQAIRGELDSDLVRQAELIDLDGKPRTLDVVQTYIPIRDTPPSSGELGNVLGVLGIVQDVTDSLALAETDAFRDAIIVAAATGGVLFLVLFLVIFRADRIIAGGIKQLQRQQEQVEEANSQLEERNQALIHSERELAVARDQALEATRAKSDFLANTSHELRTPLNAIIGYSEMLEEQAEDLGQDDFTPDLEKINAAGKHLLQLINEVLDLSKIEAGKMELYLESFSIHDMVNGVVVITHPLVEKNANTLEVTCDESLGTMRADLTKVRQGLLNLLSNACKFTEKGMISLKVARSTQNGVDWLSFRVADTGIGMTPDQMSTLFEPFSQASASTSSQYGGTGLGLALSRSFFQMMGGDIAAESEAGKGSTFTINLPAEVVDPRSEEEPDKGPGLDSLPEGAARVLVIDDDPMARDLIQRTLSKEGFGVEQASGGQEGLRLARELRPDAITLDALMPGMDGWAVLAELKGDPDLADIPVVMVTVVDDQNLGYMLGVSEYLVKPVDRERLIAILNRYRKDNQPCSILPAMFHSDSRGRSRDSSASATHTGAGELVGGRGSERTCGTGTCGEEPAGFDSVGPDNAGDGRI